MTKISVGNISILNLPNLFDGDETLESSKLNRADNKDFLGREGELGLANYSKPQDQPFYRNQNIDK